MKALDTDQLCIIPSSILCIKHGCSQIHFIKERKPRKISHKVISVIKTSYKMLIFYAHNVWCPFLHPEWPANPLYRDTTAPSYMGGCMRSKKADVAWTRSPAPMCFITFRTSWGWYPSLTFNKRSGIGDTSVGSKAIRVNQILVVLELPIWATGLYGSLQYGFHNCQTPI